MNLLAVILWIHLLCMVSTVGVLMTAQLALAPDQRNSSRISRSIARLANSLLGLGFLAGLGYYVMKQGWGLGAHYNGVVGVKFCFLLAAAALIGISKRTDNGDLLRWIAIVLFVLASFFGISLY